MHAHVSQGLEGIGGLCQLLAHTIIDDVLVVVDEDGLYLSQNVVLLEPLQSFGSGDLAVDYTVAQRVGAVGHVLLIGLEDHLSSLVADGVGGNAHAVCGSDAADLIQVSLIHNSDAGGGGIICIGGIQLGGTGTQRAVYEQLQRADPVQVITMTGLVAVCQEGTEVVDLGEAALMISTDAAACMGYILIGLPHLSIVLVLDVVGLNRSHAHGLSIVHGSADALLVVGNSLLGNDGQHHCQSAALTDDTIGIAVGIQVDGSAGGLGSVAVDAGLLQSHRVAHSHMTAGTGADDGMLGGDLVQILTGGHPVGIGEEVLVPAAAQYDFTGSHMVLLDETAAPLDHFSQGGNLMQLDHAQALTHIVEVLVGIVEAGDNSAAFGIDLLTAGRSHGTDFSIGAHSLDDAVFNEHGLLEVAALYIDIGVYENG